MKWARIEVNRAVEVTEIDPAGRFHPSIIWVEVPDQVEQGSVFFRGEWITAAAHAEILAEMSKPAPALDAPVADEPQQPAA